MQQVSLLTFRYYSDFSSHHGVMSMDTSKTVQISSKVHFLLLIQIFAGFLVSKKVKQTLIDWMTNQVFISYLLTLILIQQLIRQSLEFQSQFLVVPPRKSLVFYLEFMFWVFSKMWLHLIRVLYKKKLPVYLSSSTQDIVHWLFFGLSRTLILFWFQREEWIPKQSQSKSCRIHPWTSKDSTLDWSTEMAGRAWHWTSMALQRTYSWCFFAIVFFHRGEIFGVTLIQPRWLLQFNLYMNVFIYVSR